MPVRCVALAQAGKPIQFDDVEFLKLWKWVRVGKRYERKPNHEAQWLPGYSKYQVELAVQKAAKLHYNTRVIFE